MAGYEDLRAKHCREGQIARVHRLGLHGPEPSAPSLRITSGIWTQGAGSVSPHHGHSTLVLLIVCIAPGESVCARFRNGRGLISHKCTALLLICGAAVLQHAIPLGVSQVEARRRRSQGVEQPLKPRVCPLQPRVVRHQTLEEV